MDTRAVSEDQLAGIGEVTRPLGEILTEVAEDRSSLTYMDDRTPDRDGRGGYR